MTEPTNIADAITAAQGRVADCYTSVDTMGGTLPEVQNLTNLPAAIESIPQGGGGDEVLAYNSTGQSLSANEKVLLRYLTPDTTKVKDYTINATSSYTAGQTYVQPVWFNNNLFCVFAGFNTSGSGTQIGSFAYSYNGSTWSKTALTGIHEFNNNEYGVSFRYLDNVGMLVNAFDYVGNHSVIDSSGQLSHLFSGSYYYYWDRVGLLNGVYWDSKYSYGGSHDSGIYANNTRLTTEGYTKGHYLDVTNKLILYTEGGTVKISAIGDDNASITATYNTGDIGTHSFVGCTGLGEGDYVFFADDYDKEKFNNMSQYNNSQTSRYGTIASSYSVFKVGSDHKLRQINSSDTLYPYINIDKSLWRFDNRNNCLVIGTTDNVYVLEFKNGAWTLIASDMPLPNNNSGQYIYNASLSPDKTKLAVYAGDTNFYAQGLFIYDLATEYTWTVVQNSATNYDNVLSFTGVATGNTETVGGVTYDVINTVLPPAEEVSCTLDMGETIYVPALSII
ncbi:MAG: hypothetical protein J6S85_02090 [Methanobrevibacter sp.]|nr:hypothetical protein [Methanobrevibacter sp.]